MSKAVDTLFGCVDSLCLCGLNQRRAKRLASEEQYRRWKADKLQQQKTEITTSDRSSNEKNDHQSVAEFLQERKSDGSSNMDPEVSLGVNDDGKCEQTPEEIPVSCKDATLMALDTSIMRVLLGGRRLLGAIEAGMNGTECVLLNEAWVDHVHSSLLPIIDCQEKGISYDEGYSRVWICLDWINKAIATMHSALPCKFDCESDGSGLLADLKTQWTESACNTLQLQRDGKVFDCVCGKQCNVSATNTKKAVDDIWRDYSITIVDEDLEEFLTRSPVA